ncbi:MAG: helix-turn-helix domain-containing protein [Anaerolineae bacterium]|nr:helix-turn-helix domain-containing protein [Anaerolineae bacterium]
MTERKSGKSLPVRPMAGGTNNGSRLTRYTYWRTGYGAQFSNADFYIVQAGEYHCKPGYVANQTEYDPSQTHFFYHLEGEATFRSPRFCLQPTAGSIIVVPPQTTFQYSSPQAMKQHWFGIGGKWPTVLGEPAQVLFYGLDPDPETEGLFVEMREILILKKPGYALRAVSLFFELLARVEERSKTSASESAYPDAMRNAITFLRENYAVPFNATQTAAAVGISPSHLRALFEKWLGESPKKFHTRHRIKQAKRLLSQQKLSVSEVAFHVGFADVHHFSRVFKQITGMAPSQYDKAE